MDCGGLWGHKNMEKRQKTDSFEIATKPSLFPDNPQFRGPLFVKTKPISQIQETLQPLAVEALTAIYSPNYDKKTNPIQTQTNPIFEMENPPSSKIIKKWKTNPISMSQVLMLLTAIEMLTTIFRPKIQKETNPNEPN